MKSTRARLDLIRNVPGKQHAVYEKTVVTSGKQLSKNDIFRFMSRGAKFMFPTAVYKFEMQCKVKTLMMSGGLTVICNEFIFVSH